MFAKINDCEPALPQLANQAIVSQLHSFKISHLCSHSLYKRYLLLQSLKSNAGRHNKTQIWPLCNLTYQICMQVDKSYLILTDAYSNGNVIIQESWEVTVHREYGSGDRQMLRGYYMSENLT